MGHNPQYKPCLFLVKGYLVGMKSIQELLPLITKDESRVTERGELFKTFLGHLNPPRKEKKLRPLTYARLGRIFEGVPTQDLYYLDSVCRQAKNYSAMFWHKTKPVDKPLVKNS